MLVRQRRQVGGVFAIGMLAGAAAWLIGTQGARRAPPRSSSLIVIHPPRSRFETALREAGRLRGMAVGQVGRELESLAEWDPQAGEVVHQAERQAWGEQMAQDRGGYLRRAMTRLEYAASLAQTPEEKYRVTARMALVECNMGQHGAELRLARRLVALQPGNELSFLWLRRSARCRGDRHLEAAAGRQLERIRSAARRPKSQRLPDPGN